jgi:hypothetical protein
VYIVALRIRHYETLLHDHRPTIQTEILQFRKSMTRMLQLHGRSAILIP